MVIVKKVFTIAMVIFIVALCSAEVRAKFKIGLLLYTQESHHKVSLQGVLDQLEKEGFGASSADFIVERAEGSKAKAVEAAKRFAADKVDLVIVVGTSATMIVANEIKDVPVVFAMVYDPVGTNIVHTWKGSGNNLTGTSNKIPMSYVINTLKRFAPVKKLAVLYEPSEKNSVLQLKELQADQSRSQITVISIPITRREDVTQVLPNVMANADALFIGGSRILGEMVPVIVDIATRAKLITVTHLQERVEKGVLLGICANSYAVGVLAGGKAAQVLRGAKPSSIPIGTLSKFDVLINMKTAKAGQFTIPPAFMETATKTGE